MAKDIKLQRAKGRPMLTWVGKKPLTSVKAYPAQHVESFNATDSEPNEWTDWPDQYPQGGLLFHGDNKDVLAHLLANGFRGKIKLIYIDPPFDSGADYVRKVQLRGVSGSQKLDGEEYTLGEQIQYTDIWANDNYLQFMYERLTMLRELLHETGNIVVHCDSTRSHHLRCLLDEIFGADKAFKNEIIWFYRRWPSNTPAFQSMHDNLFWYSKSITNTHTFNKQYEAASERTLSDYGGKRLTTVQSEDGTWVKRETEEESLGVPMRDVWDIPREHTRSNAYTDYPTQKPRALLERLIEALSGDGDLVLDSFIGSGTTVAVAQQLGRRWIGCDINKGAIQTTAKRLQNIMCEQAGGSDEEKATAQLSFSTWRVNDYDLQIQHNEAVNLACDYIGITRQRTDSYFDGTYGQQLAKIIPFNHPLTPLDLEQLKTELEARPQEERDITLVCMGIELAAQSWVERHNQNRPINRIKVIELRTDDRYGAFIQHEPLTASIDVRSDGDELIVEVTDVLSPSILKRLNMEQGVFRAQIDDWRAVVDCIMIDSAYNGETFNVQCSDVPAKKTDLVSGQYVLPKPPNGSTVAVKVIDMLGEETVVSTTV